jgi:TRAP-type C4-dicarboxylate transport system permease small subunit
VKNFIRTFAAILDRVCLFSLWLSGTCLVGMVAVIAYVVFGRYILHSTPSWGEALAITLMGWFIFFGAAAGVYERTHLGFDVLLYVVPPRAKAVMHTISDIAVFAFGVGMLYYGVGLAVDTWDAIRPTLGIPDGARYIPLALGGLLACLFSLKSLMARFAGLGDAVDIDRSHATLSS